MRNAPRAKATGSSETRRASASAQPSPSSTPTILLSVAGLSPQVITETLYCLIAKSKPPVPIREIRVVTTRAGAERVREQLLHPRHGWFHRFCRDFQIPPGSILFDLSCILVPRGPGGEPLDDVRTPADNALVADSILSLVRDLTRDAGTSLHCSVAGGRKTMGLFLGIAFQLFARSQDRLSHVLVWPPEMEGHREFFYPPPRPTAYRRAGRPSAAATSGSSWRRSPSCSCGNACMRPAWRRFRIPPSSPRSSESWIGWPHPRPWS